MRPRLAALASARHSLCLFWEHLPGPPRPALQHLPVSAVERQLTSMTTFLRGTRLLHMDAHLGDMRADGGHLYLTDFGLATSPHFTLTGQERAFVDAHAGYDADHTITGLVNWPVTSTFGTTDPAARDDVIARCADGYVPDAVPPAVADVLARHAATAARMNAFLWRQFAGEVTARYS